VGNQALRLGRLFSAAFPIVGTLRESRPKRGAPCAGDASGLSVSHGVKFLEEALMLKSIEGVCRNGIVELLEPAPAEGKVIVTFIELDAVDLRDRGIDQQQAADLRQRLKTFSRDWDRPEMDAYDAGMRSDCSVATSASCARSICAPAPAQR
jgi:hypothetical protein